MKLTGKVIIIGSFALLAVILFTSNMATITTAVFTKDTYMNLLVKPAILYEGKVYDFSSGNCYAYSKNYPETEVSESFKIKVHWLCPFSVGTIHLGYLLCPYTPEEASGLIKERDTICVKNSQVYYIKSYQEFNNIPDRCGYYGGTVPIGAKETTTIENELSGTWNSTIKTTTYAWYNNPEIICFTEKTIERNHV